MHEITENPAHKSGFYGNTNIKKEKFMENHNSQLLNAIFKNVTMATHAIDSIQDKIEDKKLLKLIEKQNSIYGRITSECKRKASEINEDIDAINPLLKMTSSASINLKTMMNDDTNHIAEMLIQGTTMGITDILKSMGEFKTANKEIRNIATDLQHAEEEFIDSLKTFLTKK